MSKVKNILIELLKVRVCYDCDKSCGLGITCGLVNKFSFELSQAEIEINKLLAEKDEEILNFSKWVLKVETLKKLKIENKKYEEKIQQLRKENTDLAMRLNKVTEERDKLKKALIESCIQREVTNGANERIKSNFKRKI